MKVVITGGTGFIGSRLALTCIERGFRVKVIGQENTDAERENRRLIEEKGAEITTGSVTSREKQFDAVAGADIVFHLAAAQHEVNVPDKHFMDVNVEGTRNMLEAALRAGVKRFVHGSTIGVYGEMEGIIDEHTPTKPDNIYGKTKLEGEKLVLSYRDNLPVVVIRIPETYGPGDRRLLKLFRGIDRQMFFMIGNGENLHHLIYVDDLIEAFLKSATSEEAVGEIFLVAGKDPVTTNEMVETIAGKLGKNPPRIRAPLSLFMTAALIMEKTLRPLRIQPPLHRRRMDFFKKSFTYNLDKSRYVLKFEGQTSFGDGVEETANWYRYKGLLDAGKRGYDVSGLEDIEVGEITKRRIALTAKFEAFDSFWEAPEKVEKGYVTFHQFYRHNYLKFIPGNRSARILVISCGPGYFVDLLDKEGYRSVLGIDSDPNKVKFARKRNLNCRVEEGFAFLEDCDTQYDVIIAEQEINHLTKDEILVFLQHCRNNMNDGGTLIIHSLNGANPITGAEALAQNFDHFNTFTDYSMRQILEGSGFRDIQVIPLNLYVFYKNPLNYVAILIDRINTFFFRFNFKLYGKANKIFTKKIGAIAKK